ncbi:MAG: MBL fold metallo-hydrolase, partial [Actinobacteria bacterium]|nr:MBL fold metallo-hydrolase [Actinomycetota bacterium]NIU21852.1 MBL fold metallo-hydrolase [Actinomycetota bacterium]NIV89951.1 MBL fold metallo-hydrolase [Actinomycetota bacterium]NIX24377.1 MBL fold metallo-hydrolase [Actinomycetota bacterium]
MSFPIPLAPVERVSVTVLVDNIADLLLPSDEVVRRPSLDSGPTVPVSVFEGPGPDVVRAEHGYSALVTVDVGGSEHRVLFDTGISPDGMVENMRRLDVDPKGVEAVVMSHGHLDHTGGLDGFIDAVGRANVPLLLHPDFWLRRRLVIPGSDPIEIPSPSRRALEDGGFDIVED